MHATLHGCVQRLRRHGLTLLGSLLFLLPRPAQAQQQLVWEENFDGPAINQSNWTFDQGDGCAQGVCGWGNSELQTYTNRPDNARVENGHLVIEARRENYQGRGFTSARLKTLGRVQFKYGTLEARIKVPNLQNGLWPAFWMLGATGNWPASGEIDIMEMGSAAAIQAGTTNRRVGGATHWEHNNAHAAYDTHYIAPTDLTADYHVYRMSWDNQFIRMYIDGHEYYAIDISTAAAGDLEEFHQAQYILLNLAVGGQYTGLYGAGDISAPLPGQMLVDYVRLYQSPGDELYLGANNGIAGDFGVYTENPAITQRLVYGQDANLYLWNNLTNISPAPAPYEGQQVLALHANAGSWFGFGVANDVKNLVAFEQGALKLQFKTAYAGQFKFGLKSGAGESWVDFPAGTTRFGLQRDGQWHEVVIPLSAFGNGDLGSVQQAFMFAGDAASAPADFYFDHLYYSGGVAANPAPTVALTAPTNEALVTTPGSVTLTANAADANGSVTKVEFYQGFTLLGTATSAPYSFTWASPAPGTYSLTAKATDDQGIVTTSAPRTLFVAAPNNAAPTVALTAPTASSSFTTPATVSITADATDADGSVYKVEFYQGTTLLGTDYASPYTYTWAGVTAGTYSLTAKVTDNGRLSTSSAPVSVTVRSNVVSGPKFGVYSEDAQIQEKLSYGQDANLYLWNNLANIPAAAPPYEGQQVLALRAAAGNWFGFGIANSIKNLAAFAGGSLRLQFKTSYGGQFKFGVKTGGQEGWVDFAPGATAYGLQRDGQWHEVAIPLSAFGNLDWATLEQAFMVAGDAPAAPADFYFDDLYFSTQPVVVPPVTYCGTAASGDYSYAVTSSGNNVSFTFHPLGATAGGNLAILYVNGPGYGMTRNAAGDFTYTLTNQTPGQVLNFYFTYQVGPGGPERNSAASPHQYTVGSPCGTTPAPQAPTVSLTSPAAAASFAAPATITLTAAAADADGTVSQVEFYQGTTLLGTATAAPYSFAWTGVAAGSYSLTARATDNSGLSTTSAAVAVTVTGSGPTGPGGYCGTAANGDFSWAAVSSGSDVTFTFHPLGATAGGNLAILYVNGPGYLMTKNAAGDFTYTVRNQTSGAVLSLYFTYQVGPGGLERNTAATPAQYTVGQSCAPANAAPAVSLTSPVAGATLAAPATLTLTAAATDSDGTISRVEFYQGATLLGTATAAPYSFAWTNVPVGSYSLTARATDNGGLSTTSAAVSISVAYADADGDGYPADQDCDDHNPAVHPGLTFYRDADGDGFGGSASTTACTAPSGYVAQTGDCNDQDAAINPGAADVCGQDRNCDGRLEVPAQAAPTVAVQPASGVYTGGNAQTIYLGYGPQSVTLTASAPGATAYSWSPVAGLSAPAGARVTFAPTAAGSYPLQVTARNAAGCAASASVVITVVDARVPGHPNKVRLCHQGQELEVSTNAAPAHLNHGDQLGRCPAATASRGTAAPAADAPPAAAELAADVLLTPNPAQDRATLAVTLPGEGAYSLSIYDLRGSLVKQVSTGQAGREQQLSFELDTRALADGVYLVRLVTTGAVVSKRLLVRH